MYKPPKSSCEVEKIRSASEHEVQLLTTNFIINIDFIIDIINIDHQHYLPT